MKYSDIKSEDDLRKYIQSQNKAAEPQIAANKKKSESQVATIKKSGTEGLKKQQEAQKAAKQAAKQAENNSAYSGLKTADEITSYLQKKNAAVKANASKTKNTGTKVQNTTPTKATNPHHGKNNTISHGRKAQYKEQTKQGLKDAYENSAGAKAWYGLYSGLSFANNDQQMDDIYGEGTSDKLKDSKAYTAGKVAGTLVGMAAPYGAVSSTAKVANIGAKAAKSAKVVNAAEKLGQSSSKLANAVGKALPTIASGAAKDAVTTAVTSPITNAAYNAKEGLTGSELASKTAKDTALDFAFGAGFEAIGGVLGSVLKGAKKIDNTNIKDVAEELASQPQQTREEILKEFKEKGYVTDEQHALLAEYANQKRGKNVETPSVIDNRAEELDDSVSGLLNAPEKPYQIKKKRLEGLIDEIWNEHSESKANEIATANEKPTHRYATSGRDVDYEYFEGTAKEKLDKLIDSAANYIGNYKGKGATRAQAYWVPIGHNEARGNEVLMEQIRFQPTISHNDQWYQDYLKKYGKKPAKRETYGLAKEIVMDEINQTLQNINHQFNKSWKSVDADNEFVNLNDVLDIVAHTPSKKRYSVGERKTFEGLPSEFDILRDVKKSQSTKSPKGAYSDAFKPYINQNVGSAMTDEAIAKSQEKIWGERLPNTTEQQATKAAEKHELDEVQKTFESSKPKTENAEAKLPQASTTAKPEDVKVPVSKDTDLPRNTVTVTEAPKASKTELSEADDALNAISKGEAVGKVKGMFRKLYKNLVSGTAEIERMAGRQKEVGAELTANELTQALRTKTGTVNAILKNKLVDKAGNVINDRSYMDVMGQVPEQDLDLFNEYVQNLHNIDRWAQDKPLFEQISADESRQKVADILQQHPEFAQYQQDLKAWWDDFTQAWYVDTGIWSQETADYVRTIYPNYVPGFREGNKIKPGDTNSILTKIGALKRAKGGSSDVIPVQDSFLALINQAVSKSRKNELYANIIDTFERYGDDFKDFGVMTDAKSTVNPLDALDSVDEKNMEEVREGIYKLTAYVNGEEKSAYITKEMRDALALANDVYGGSEALKLVHDIASPLSNLRKSIITGLSPVFGTANLFRDVPTYYIQSQQSPLKATSSLFKAAKEIATKGDLYETYKALGGTQAGYYTQGKGFSDVVKSYKKSGLDKVKGVTPFKAIEAYNETLETLPRLAEFIGMIEKYGDDYASRLKALDAAADVTTNFARSAPITKAADGWIMYLNASVQGLDKFARQVKNKPLATATKSAVLLTMPYAMLYAVNKDNPHYQDLTDRVKQNYFVIPNIWGEKDEDGYAKTFFKIPLNREYGAIMASSLDLAFSYFEGGMDDLESASKSYKETLGTNFVPPGIEDNVLSFVGEIQNNEDYAGQKIVPTAYEDASPQYQTDINTSGIANTLAGLAQQSRILPDAMKSPMNVDYALSQMGYPGQLAQAVTSQQIGTAGERAYNTAVQPFADRFTADPRQSSGVVSKFYDELNKAETEVKDQELSGEVAKGYNSPTKEYKNSLSATSQEMSDLMKQEKEILANNALTKAEKKQKSNEIREQRNELARNATKTASSAQKAYEKVYVKELADLDDKWQQEYQAVKGQVSATKYKSGYSAQKGVKGGDVAKALKVYDATGEEALLTQYGITESGAQKAQSLINVQLAYEDYVKMKKNADSDGNGYIKTAEAKAYLNNSDYSNKQKAALYAALTSAKKNPYN